MNTDVVFNAVPSLYVSIAPDAFGRDEFTLYTLIVGCVGETLVFDTPFGIVMGTPIVMVEHSSGERTRMFAPQFGFHAEAVTGFG
jgi:hypothetical protein